MEYDIIKIRSLCDRYFDGDTTADEEMMLRSWLIILRLPDGNR